MRAIITVKSNIVDDDNKVVFSENRTQTFDTEQGQGKDGDVYFDVYNILADIMFRLVENSGKDIDYFL